jgi:hypothetical protein
VASKVYRFARPWTIIFLFVLFLFTAVYQPSAGEQADSLSAFSDPVRIWGSGAEAIIEEAYRQCFKTFIIGEQIMNLRMPFAQNNERDTLTNRNWGFLEGGKGNPVFLWGKIEEALNTQDFKKYVETLGDGREKVIIFDLPRQSWTASRDLFDIGRMKAGSYRGLPHRPYVLVTGKGIAQADVYNYLYCVGPAGMDCSGFVWHVLSYIGSKGGVDLGAVLSRSLGVPRGSNPSWYVGTGFYNATSSHISPVEDEIRKLQPGDILLFRSHDGEMAHSAIIQSVNFSSGVIRYLQCTDEAPLSERGVHESFIRFDPARPRLSLQDPSLLWTQKRYPPFPGEIASPFSDDGERYRAYPDLGGGKVVRIKIIASLIAAMNKN